jgi:hypothetical protein
MELQTCAYISPNVSSFNSNYGKINITSVIMCFLIIYSTALSIVLSVKQLIQIIKEEELLKEEEYEDEEKEEEEQEVIDRVEVQTQTNEEDYKEEEEMLLANYNAKERALALQAAYDERAKLTFEKWREAHSKLFKIKQELAAHGDEGFSYTENANMYRTFMIKMQEEYFQTNEKLTRLEAFNALKKARTLDLEHYKEFIHLFNS